VVEYTHTDGQTPPPPVMFTFLIEANGNGKREPKVDTGTLPISEKDVDTGSSGGSPRFPSMLSYDKNGYISKLTVSMSPSPTPVGSCPFVKADDPHIRIDQPDK
jgi:hypothetical protein